MADALPKLRIGGSLLLDSDILPPGLLQNRSRVAYDPEREQSSSVGGERDANPLALAAKIFRPGRTSYVNELLDVVESDNPQ